MKYFVVGVRDQAAGAFMRPLFFGSIGQAVRSFQDEVNRAAEDNAMYRHPEDFELFHLGYFNENTGGMESLSSPISIAVGKQMAVRS